MEGSGRNRWKRDQNTQSQEHMALASSLRLGGVQGRLTLAKPDWLPVEKGQQTDIYII